MKTKVITSHFLLLFVSEVYSQFKVNTDGSDPEKGKGVYGLRYAEFVFPFSEHTLIRFFISEGASSVQLCIYDLQGKQHSYVAHYSINMLRIPSYL